MARPIHASSRAVTATVDPVSRRLAETLSRTSPRSLPADVVEHARRAVLDWLGSALAGTVEPPARMGRQVAMRLGASQEATVFGAGRASAPAAALANGIASHVLELDDVHKGSTLHAAAPIVPAALAVAERERADGRTFWLAVTLGYEAAFRIGEAVNPSHYRFWHPTGTVATFGAAAAAGTILRLNDAEMLQALGTAGTQAAGLWEFNADGAMSKPLHPGKAAFNGILAADLARAGFTGASRILEGERGFFRAESTGADPSRITEGLGERWKIGENCYKLHACCGHTHTAIDVALELRQRLGTDEAVAAQITEIRIGTYGPGFAIVKELNPRSSYQAQFSLAYCVAVALLDGRAGLEQFAGRRFGPNGVEDSALAALLERTRITVDDTLTGKYPAAWPARLELVLRNGDRLQGEADFPRGNPENPVSTDTLREKLLSLVGERFGRETAHRALEAVQSIDRADDMSRVFSLFSSLTPVAR